ncbi:TolC family protein [Myxococcota bacterium]
MMVRDRGALGTLIVLGVGLVLLSPALGWAQQNPPAPAPAQPAAPIQPNRPGLGPNQPAGPNQAAAPAAPTPAGPNAGDPSQLELREAPKPTLSAIDPLASHAGGLTADQVAQKALASSPTLTVRQAEIDAASAQVSAAMVNFFPQLTLKASYARTSAAANSLGGGGALVGAANQGPITVGSCAWNPALDCPVDSQGGPLMGVSIDIPTTQDNYTLTASLAVPVSDYLLRLSKTMAATRASERSARITKQAEELKTATDARIAYYNWLRGVAGVTVAESALVRIHALKKDSNAAFSVGAATKADVLRVEALAASTELTITETRNLKQLAAEQLAVLMNEPVREYQVGESVRTPPPTAGKEAPLSTLVSEAHQRRLELKAIGEADRSLRRSLEVVEAGKLPRLDAFGEFNYARPNRNYMFDAEKWHSNWMVGAQLSWKVNDVFANNASALELEANRRKMQAQIENLKRGLRMEVTSAYLDEKKAFVAASTAQRGLQAAQEAYRVAVDLYRVGRATTTELIAAEQELLAASLKEVNAAIDYRLANIRLAHATGRDVPSQ